VLIQGDYLRVKVSNGTVSLVRRVGAGLPTTLWSGSLPQSASVRQFELRMNAQSVSLYEGPVGAASLRIGPIAHGLSWQAASVYLYGETNAASVPFVVDFDTVRIVRGQGP
jgi:hypothetical protein